jgi:GMP synthase-like glutamine amidotransferase
LDAGSGVRMTTKPQTLIISICEHKLHELEFVKPIEAILKQNRVTFKTKHYKEKFNVDAFSKIIICGTSLKDNEFLKKENISKFRWILDLQKNQKLLGICGGAHIIGLVHGRTLKKKKEIGLKELNIKKEFLGLEANSKAQVYHLHKFYTLPDIFKHNTKQIYGVLFHPEVRNKNIIKNFCISS